MSSRTTTILPPPSFPDEDEVYLAELTPIENLAVAREWIDAEEDVPTIPAPPPEEFNLL